jgi:hypothetical protein
MLTAFSRTTGNKDDADKIEEGGIRVRALR